MPPPLPITYILNTSTCEGCAVGTAVDVTGAVESDDDGTVSAAAAVGVAAGVAVAFGLEMLSAGGFPLAASLLQER